MQNIKVQMITLQEGKTKIQFHYEEQRQGITQIITANKTFKFGLHNDLQEAIDALKAHFVLLTEMVKTPKGKDLDKVSVMPVLDEFAIKQIKFTDKGTIKGVVITAQRTLEEGRVFKCPTPFANFDGETHEYKYVQELANDCEVVKDEIAQYIQGKFSVEGTQLTFGDMAVEAA